MWKVAAADDEAYLRTALKKLMNWEKMGCELIRVVNNGKEPVSYTHLDVYKRQELKEAWT